MKIPEYTKQEFYDIGVKLLQTPKYGKTAEIAGHIVDQIWNIYTETRKEKPNLRQCVQVANLTFGSNDKSVIDPILKGITTYSKRYEE